MLGAVKSLICRTLDSAYGRYAAPPPAVSPSVGPCLAIRHDMDGLTVEHLEDIRTLEGRIGVRSTCFFLLHQFKRYPEILRRLRGEGWDVQLHTEARPRIFLTITRDRPKYGTMLTQWSYARRLRRQFSRCAALGFPTQGHTPHGINQCLEVYNEWSWSIIEWATCRTGFQWMSNSRATHEVPNPGTRSIIPPYHYLRPAGDPLVIFPTAFDDGWLFPSWDDRLLGRPRHTQAEAQGLLDLLAEKCVRQGIPLIINLHPWWWFTNTADGSSRQPLYQFSIVESVVDAFRKHGLPVLPLSALYEKIAHGGRAE